MKFKPVGELTIEEVRDEIYELARMVRVLQWDKLKDQINPAKLDKLQQFQKRLDELRTRFEVRPE